MPENSGKKSDYLYLSIYKELKKSILNGDFKKGETFPPERQLKDRYGTTHVTVRNALSLLVEEGYIERYSGKGTIVVYEGHAGQPVNDRSVKGGSLHFVLPEMNEAYAPLVREFNRLRLNGSLKLRLDFSHGDAELEKMLVRSAAANKDCLIVYEPTVAEAGEFLPESVAGRAVLINPLKEVAGITSLRQDLAKGALDGMALLKRLGYDKVAFIDWERTYRGVSLGEGYEKAIRDLEMVGSPTLRANCMGLREAAYDACARLLQEHPDCRAFLCANDLSAGGVFNFLQENDLLKNSPSIIGCGNHPLSEILGVSSIDLNMSKATRILMSLYEEFVINGSLERADYKIQTEMILRKTPV